MIRLVTEMGKPVTGSLRVTGPDAAVGGDNRPAAKAFDCSVELMAIIACSMVEGLVRTSAIRPESGEHVLMKLVETLGDLVVSAPHSIADHENFRDLANRLQASAIMLRERCIELTR